MENMAKHLYKYSTPTTSYAAPLTGSQQKAVFEQYSAFTFSAPIATDEQFEAFFGGMSEEDLKAGAITNVASHSSTSVQARRPPLVKTLSTFTRKTWNPKMLHTLPASPSVKIPLSVLEGTTLLKMEGGSDINQHMHLHSPNLNDQPTSAAEGTVSDFSIVTLLSLFTLSFPTDDVLSLGCVDRCVWTSSCTSLFVTGVN